MDEKSKIVSSRDTADSGRPLGPWETGGCPFIIFGDDDAADYDLEKVKKFFSKFRKKKKSKDVD